MHACIFIEIRFFKINELKYEIVYKDFCDCTYGEENKKILPKYADIFFIFIN